MSRRDELLHATHYVYEMYSSEGEPLYVGCTNNLGTRLTEHHSKPWWAAVATIQVTPHRGLEAGRIAEQQRIQALSPPHNDIFNRPTSRGQQGWETRRRREEERHAAGLMCHPRLTCRACSYARIVAAREVVA